MERNYIARKARQQGWREIVLYRKEHAAAGLIQRWTRGVLVRRRTPLVSVGMLKHECAGEFSVDRWLLGYVVAVAAFLLSSTYGVWEGGTCYVPRIVSEPKLHMVQETVRSQSLWSSQGKKGKIGATGSNEGGSWVADDR